MRRRVEVDIEQKACVEIKKLGIRNIKINTKTETGWPDRMFLIPGGKPLFIEFKLPGKELKPKQEYIHGILHNLGYSVETHDSVDGAVSAVSRALEAARRTENWDEVLARACVRHSGRGSRSR
jgi:uncharacterized protein YyaL (SSP411 family)